MATVGFLHTAHAHVRTFRDLLHQRDETVAGLHLVDTGLLAAARARGAASVRDALADRLRRLVAEGAELVLTTCSETGPEAERVGAEVGVRVLRVDRPMAEAAVLAGRRIALVSSLDDAAAALRPLLHESAAATGREVQLVEVRCLDAWPSFESGDLETYSASVADTVRREVRALRPPVDVVVLAQASMIGAAPLLRDLDLPVLTSPRLAVEAVVEMVVPIGR
ncbi:aspartate/glutamate racemase family protein [Paenibacillus sp. TRM 82003]|uniref:aspartate/glutamate racemase family protein n=1 Tax=Kineococcus sp. TRM81007 TaxID=2925831 RepID=UPI001F55CBC5|nr:aspartate/glutamate racemase family protein [Kineococcus sp. TRM81007]MCI2240329.1 aspartate/glutamate racemase family protein [Kineococcus sp. TRM81007]MCI3927494.1 aspartate/glutamate racemase family protein [Paenibacillus sp. TRM 82003]